MAARSEGIGCSDIIRELVVLRLFYSNLEHLECINCIGKNIGKGGFENHPFKGFCLETQYFPDAINHENFKQPVFGPEEEYKTTTVYQFSW